MKPESVALIQSRMQSSKRNQMFYMGIGLGWMVFGMFQMWISISRHRSLTDSTPLVWCVVAMLFVIQAFNETNYQSLCEMALTGDRDADSNSNPKGNNG